MIFSIFEITFQSSIIIKILIDQKQAYISIRKPIIVETTIKFKENV